MKMAIAIALLVGGGILLYLGLDASDSFASEVSKVVDDTPSDRSVGLMVGGGVALAAGIGLLVFSRGKS